MSARYLLDTNVLSEPLRPKPDRGLLVRLERFQAQVATAAVVYHELLFGLERLPPSRKRDRIETYLVGLRDSALPIIPYDQRAAEWHARERARLQAKGRNLPFRDTLIAATAYVNDLVVVTSNIRDFTGLSGLEAEDWRAESV